MNLENSSSNTVNVQAFKQGFSWSQWIGNFFTVFLLQLAIVLCTLLVLVCLIKLVQAKIIHKNTAQNNQSLQQKTKQQLNLKTLQSTISKLKSFHQTFAIYYSLYKQLLYIKTGAYHGTNMTSIFATLSKQTSQNHVKQSQSDFESDSILKLRQMITLSAQALIDLFKGTIGHLLISDTQVKEIESLFKESQKKALSNLEMRLSDIFQYHLPMKNSLIQLNEKVSKLNEDLRDLKHKEHQQFIELVKNLVFNINSFLKFLTYIIKSFIQSPLNDQSYPFIESKPIQQQINSILSQICNETLKQKPLSHKKDSKQRIMFQLKNNLSSAINQFNFNGNQSFRNCSNPIDFLDQQISSLNKLLQQFQINKSAIQKSRNPEINTFQQIKVYSTNISQIIEKDSQNGKVMSLKNFNETSTVQQSQTAFSAQKQVKFHQAARQTYDQEQNPKINGRNVVKNETKIACRIP